MMTELSPHAGTPDETTGMGRPASRVVVLSILLALMTLAAFFPVVKNDFVNFDDDRYVTRNRQVMKGLAGDGVLWALKTKETGNWHPLTWISHMIDVEIFGLDPAGHHLVSLMFHTANVILLFLVLNGMTGAVWRSAFTAALFGLHPLHVESVAWIAERKDVLSTFFFMLAMGAYLRYVRRPGLAGYLVTAACFSLGLTAKPMLVTFPLVLLLLDYWPLGRFSGSVTSGRSVRPAVMLVMEKVPLLLLSAASSVVTYAAQQSIGAVASWELLPISTRVSNALLSYQLYIRKMLFPLNLAVYYPMGGEPAGAIIVAASGLFLAAVSILVLWSMRSRPWLATGWYWYLGTLFPVIGLVQVGGQAMADRYTYISYTGLFIIISWGAWEIVARIPGRKLVTALAAGVVLAVLFVMTSVQAGYWRDSITLFDRALEVTTDNHMAHNNLCLALADEGMVTEAMEHCRKSLEIEPDLAQAHNNLGGLLLKQGREAEAERHFMRVLKIDPGFPEAHYNLGSILFDRGDLDGAGEHLLAAVRLNPQDEKAHNNLGSVLLKKGRRRAALGHFLEAGAIDPAYAEAIRNAGVVLTMEGRHREAMEQFERALELVPDDAVSHYGAGVALARDGDLDRAVRHFAEAVRIRPDYPEAHYNLGMVLMSRGCEREGTEHLDRAAAIDPSYAKQSGGKP